MIWTPLQIPAAATPEEAFAAGAVHSRDSQVILLAWVKGAGWCGCRGVPPTDTSPGASPDTILLRINDTLILSATRGGLPYHHMMKGENGDS